MEHEIKISLMAILSLIFMSTVASKHCNTSFDCHDQECMFGFPICLDHVCGCGGQSLYKIPETPQH
ncbi:hypothetical protein DCAR_0414904 [Daucus carota subsp. sativus]|uniref:Late nodulin n=1 Tax=Daucus carota subsp. sativus TaxID=79200 RepID=A0AAF1AUM5_DAUCS|nr:hypothetical protein DCAR_0414904 [Daucus carota subsp. sativus]